MKKIIMCLVLSSMCQASETPTYDRLISEAHRSPTDINLLKACTAASAGISEAICAKYGPGPAKSQEHKQCLDFEELACCYDTETDDDMCMRSL